MKKHKLEWYIPETDNYIYDEEVIKYLTLKLNNSISSLKSIEDLINLFKRSFDSSTPTSEYLEYEELLSEIQVILECHFNNR